MNIPQEELDRWADVALVADLRPTDAVLDLGCAEGLLATTTFVPSGNP